MMTHYGACPVYRKIGHSDSEQEPSPEPPCSHRFVCLKVRQAADGTLSAVPVCRACKHIVDLDIDVTVSNQTLSIPRVTYP